MKKLPKYLTTLSATLMVWGAFLVPSAFAYTITADNPAPLNEAYSPQINVYANPSLQNPGTLGTLTVYLYDSIATTGTQIYGQLYSAGGSPLDCTTPLLNFFEVGGSTVKPGGFSLVGPFSGADCPITFPTTNVVKVFDGGGSLVFVGFGGSTSNGHIWFRLTTDTASSSLYTLQARYLAIATTTSFANCNATFDPSGGVSANISNSLCQVVAYLTVPNDQALQSFSALTDLARSKIPFSYYYDVSTILTGASASTTDNFTPMSINFSSVDFSSSTAMGPLLPSGSFEFLSSSTINRYLPVGMHDFLMFLARSAIWVGVMLIIYRRIVPHKPTI